MRPIGTAEELERRRRRAVELVKQGESPAQVAHFLGCGRSSVYTWVKLDRDAAEKLAAKPHTGPKPRLTDEQAKAHLVFLDESGFQLTPVVRRTYAPRGKTPILEAWHRKGRISAISAVTVSPVRRRPNLYFRLLADDANAHGEDTVAFPAQLRGEIKGPMTPLREH